MIDVTILALADSSLKSANPVDKLMYNRLTVLASDLQKYLIKILFDAMEFEDLVIYLRYNSKYGVQWKIVSDVSSHIALEVAKCCNNLGYIVWEDSEI